VDRPDAPGSPSDETRRSLLRDARLYLCTDARTGPDDLRSFVRACYAGGVDIIQIRDKRLEAQDELAALAVLADEARAAGKLFSANDRADLAVLSEADVLHVGQGDLRPADAARLAPGALIGLSTHDADQMRAAAVDPDVDYFCAGPVWPTPTKPGRPGVGLELVNRTATTMADLGSDKPWFAIGGISEDTLPAVVDAGATRVVVVRVLTAANDPRATARRLRAGLP
jgi:thiamine-phosphate pyrophosphorylase